MVYRCIEGLSVLERLQLSSQIVDLVEASVTTRVDQALKLAAGCAAGGIGIADRVTLECRQHRWHPGEYVHDGREVQANGMAERSDAVYELGRGDDLLDQRVSTILVSH